MIELSNIEIERRILALGGANILKAQDILDFNEANQRIAFLMLDGQWHTADEIRIVAGVNNMSASEGLRRMRSLRMYMRIAGRPVSKNRRLWEYRVIEIKKREPLSIPNMSEYFSLAQIRAFFIASAVYFPHGAAVSTLEGTKATFINICGAGSKKLSTLAMLWCANRREEEKFFLEALDEYCATGTDNELDADPNEPNDTQELKKP
jgi:hypothetical protein